MNNIRTQLVRTIPFEFLEETFGIEAHTSDAFKLDPGACFRTG